MSGGDTGARQPENAIASGSTVKRIGLAIALVLVGIFLVQVARYYHPGTGFTSFLGLPAAGHEYEAAALRAIPHHDYAGPGVYDGQFYVQRALDPLVRDPEVDRAMDLAPFRARRILFSWTAYLAGLGRPAWVVEAYALQNVVFWLVLAWLLARWFPPTTPRGLAAWIACMFSHGLLFSVRFALLDGPSLALTALAIRFAEEGRQLLSAAVAGVNGLGRETNVLGVFAQPLPRRLRDVARLGAAAVLAGLPLLVWQDYLRSIYRSTLLAGVQGQFGTPGLPMWNRVARTASEVYANGLFSASGLALCVVLPLLVQALYLLVRPRPSSPWWRVAIAYVVLMLLLDTVVWSPANGAITRVMLPMTVGFNVLLIKGEVRGRRFWPWFVAGNLHLFPALWVL
jgi:hypothetical protein